MPWPMRYLKRWLVSAGVPKPANCRIVHSRPRYIVGCTPRVNGNSPGKPQLGGLLVLAGRPGVSRSGISMPESVAKAARRCFIFASTGASVSCFQRATSFCAERTASGA